MNREKQKALFARAVESRLGSAASEGIIAKADEYLTPDERYCLDDYSGQLIEYDAEDVRFMVDALIDARRSRYAAQAQLEFGALASVPQGEELRAQLRDAGR